MSCRTYYMRVTKDVEAALLEGSPTMSSVSSDFTDRTYVALVDDATATPTGSPTTTTTTMIEPVDCISPGLSAGKCLTDTESEDDNLIVEELTPVVIISRQSAPRPKFRIRPPYLMICISIVEFDVKIQPRVRRGPARYPVIRLSTRALAAAMPAGGGAGPSGGLDDLSRRRSLRGSRRLAVAAQPLSRRGFRWSLCTSHQPPLSSLSVSRRATLRELAPAGGAAARGRGRGLVPGARPHVARLLLGFESRQQPHRLGIPLGRCPGGSSPRSGLFPASEQEGRQGPALRALRQALLGGEPDAARRRCHPGKRLHGGAAPAAQALLTEDRDAGAVLQEQLHHREDQGGGGCGFRVKKEDDERTIVVIYCRYIREIHITFTKNSSNNTDTTTILWIRKNFPSKTVWNRARMTNLKRISSAQLVCIERCPFKNCAEQNASIIHELSAASLSHDFA
ncbi:unnamed protein product [Trichogramma brassicae]|uniref:Uncharacterized protein n=1 Tax=Trichogramma brassicae TaxID=86971 RepID=A0A6H5I553_9HYME|nr:unnamed protein product [Trichogramma brassicae]